MIALLVILGIVACVLWDEGRRCPDHRVHRWVEIARHNYHDVAKKCFLCGKTESYEEWWDVV